MKRVTVGNANVPRWCWDPWGSPSVAAPGGRNPPPPPFSPAPGPFCWSESKDKAPHQHELRWLWTPALHVMMAKAVKLQNWYLNIFENYTNWNSQVHARIWFQKNGQKLLMNIYTCLAKNSLCANVPSKDFNHQDCLHQLCKWKSWSKIIYW